MLEEIQLYIDLYSKNPLTIFIMLVVICIEYPTCAVTFSWWRD